MITMCNWQKGLDPKIYVKKMVILEGPHGFRIDFPAMGGSPSIAVVPQKWMVCNGQSLRSKWMISGATPMTLESPMTLLWIC